MSWPAYICGFMCSECPYGCETLESAMDHVKNTGHGVREFFKGGYYPAIHREVDGSTTSIKYSPPGKGLRP